MSLMYKIRGDVIAGTVRHDCGDGSYLIEDSIGNLEKIWREDAIADRDDANILINVGQPRSTVSSSSDRRV